MIGSACTNSSNKNRTIATWYEAIKVEIQKNSTQKEDSVSYILDRETLLKTYWLNGKRLRQEFRSPDTSRVYALTAFGQNELFELRSEIHSNGLKATEGLVFHDNYYGPWSVWYPNGQLNYKGFRYKDDDFGKWEYFFDDGRVREVINNNRSDLADSILTRIDLRTSIKQN